MPQKRKVASPEVFISHSSKNATFVNRLEKVVTGHGVKTFVSKTNIQGAQQWHDEIGAALKRCDWFLLVLSPESVRSTWVKHELIYALRSNRFKKRIIPLLYKDCKADLLSWTLPGIEWVDFRRDFNEACGHLLDIWQLTYKPDHRA